MADNKEPLISIIVPIYNVQQYLSKCISSIRQQTYKNMQIILVDDGSTDGSSLICAREALQDSRIEVIRQENKGLVAARKAGLNIARGGYIGFVDGDDYIERNMYAELLAGLIESNADFIHSGFYENGKQVRTINDYSGGKYDISRHKTDIICDYVLKAPPNAKMTITPSIWSKLYKADLIKSAYSNVPDCQQYGEDMICLCACILKADTMVLTKNAYYQYTVREDSLSHSREIKDIIKYTGLYAALCELFKNFKIYDVIEKNLDAFLMQFVTDYVRYAYGGQIYIEKYKFCDMRMLKGKKVVIYGAGKVGQDYYRQIVKYKGCKIAGWIDADFSRYNFANARVQGVHTLRTMEYDRIIIAVKNEEMANEIMNALLNDNVSKEKILWCKPKVWRVPINKVELRQIY